MKISGVFFICLTFFLVLSLSIQFDAGASADDGFETGFEEYKVCLKFTVLQLSILIK